MKKKHCIAFFGVMLISLSSCSLSPARTYKSWQPEPSNLFFYSDQYFATYNSQHSISEVIPIYFENDYRYFISDQVFRDHIYFVVTFVDDYQDQTTSRIYVCRIDYDMTSFAILYDSGYFVYSLSSHLPVKVFDVIDSVMILGTDDGFAIMNVTDGSLLLDGLGTPILDSCYSKGQYAFFTNNGEDTTTKKLNVLRYIDGVYSIETFDEIFRANDNLLAIKEGIILYKNNDDDINHHFHGLHYDTGNHILDDFAYSMYYSGENEDAANLSYFDTLSKTVTIEKDAGETSKTLTLDDIKQANPYLKTEFANRDFQFSYARLFDNEVYLVFCYYDYRSVHHFFYSVYSYFQYHFEDGTATYMGYFEYGRYDSTISTY